MEEPTEAYSISKPIKEIDESFESAPGSPISTLKISLDSSDESSGSSPEDYGTPRETVCEFFIAGKCRFGEKCFHLHPPDGSALHEEAKARQENEEVNGTHKKCRNKRINGRRRRRLWEEEEEKNRKKPSMKTAENVISRILWDESLPMEHFVVGYLDRFVGVVEKPFSAFTWEEHIASIDDYSSLAVPRHRIQYFKYKGQKVWDKNERLDLIFGSTETENRDDPFVVKTTIREFMRKVDQERLENPADTESETEEKPEIEEQLPKKVYAEKEGKPNFFICIRITNEGIKESAKQLLDHVRENHASFEETLTSEETLHITVAMLRLDTATEISRAEQILRNRKEEYTQFLWPPIDLVVNGLDHFKSRVLYAHTECPNSFLAFVNTITQLMHDNNIRVIQDFPEYVPHMTLMKIKRGSAVEKKYKYIDPFVYQQFLDTYFGNQSVNNINLCYTQERQEDGFYRTVCEIPLSLAL